MGDRAMRLLHDRITGSGEGPEQVVLPITIQTRQSAPAHLRIVGRS
jgi:LacI family transcriptional regulator